MNVIIVGCGRVGAELALRLSRRGHDVTVIDHVGSSFSHLDPAYRGRTIEAEAARRGRPQAGGHPGGGGARRGHELGRRQRGGRARRAHRLRRAERGGRATTTRAGGPLHEAMGLHVGELDRLGRAAHRGAAREPAALRPVFSAGNGEVELYELACRRPGTGRPLARARWRASPARRSSLTRGGRASAAGAGAGAARRATSCT